MDTFRKNYTTLTDGEKGMEELPELEKKALIDTIKGEIQKVIEE